MESIGNGVSPSVQRRPNRFAREPLLVCGHQTGHPSKGGTRRRRRSLPVGWAEGNRDHVHKESREVKRVVRNISKCIKRTRGVVDPRGLADPTCHTCQRPVSVRIPHMIGITAIALWRSRCPTSSRRRPPPLSRDAGTWPPSPPLSCLSPESPESSLTVAPVQFILRLKQV